MTTNQQQQQPPPSSCLTWAVDPTTNEPVLFLEKRWTRKQLEEMERRKKWGDNKFGKARMQTGGDAFTTVSNALVYIEDPDDDFEAQSFAFHGGSRKGGGGGNSGPPTRNASATGEPMMKTTTPSLPPVVGVSSQTLPSS